MKGFKQRRTGLFTLWGGSLVILTVLALVIGVTACSDSDTEKEYVYVPVDTSRAVNSMRLINPPYNNFGLQGSKLDLTGMMVEVTYNDGESEVLPHTWFYVDEQERFEEWSNTSRSVRVCYRGEVTSSALPHFNLTIPRILPLLSIHQTGSLSQIVYFEDDDFSNFAGIKLNGNYLNGTTIENYDIIVDDDPQWYTFEDNKKTGTEFKYTGVTYTVALNRTGLYPGIPSLEGYGGYRGTITYTMNIANYYRIDRVEYVEGSANWGSLGLYADQPLIALSSYYTKTLEEQRAEEQTFWMNALPSSGIRLRIWYYNYPTPKDIGMVQFTNAMRSRRATANISAPDYVYNPVTRIPLRLWHVEDYDLFLRLQYFDHNINPYPLEPGITIDYPNAAIVPLNDGIYTYQGLEIERLYDGAIFGGNRPEGGHEAQVFGYTHILKDVLDALESYYKVWRVYTSSTSTTPLRFPISRDEFRYAGCRGYGATGLGLVNPEDAPFVFSDAGMEDLTFIFNDPQSTQTQYRPIFNINDDTFIWKYDTPGLTTDEIELPFEVLP